MPPNKAHHRQPTEENDEPNTEHSHIAPSEPFQTIESRASFLRKVLITCIIQYTFCTGFVAAALLNKRLHSFFGSMAGWILTICCGSSLFFLVFVTGCFKLGSGKTSPGNVFLFILKVSLLSICMAGLSVEFNDSVMLATGTLAATCFILVIILFLPKVNNSGYILCFVAGALVAVLFTASSSIVYGLIEKPKLTWKFYLITSQAGAYAILCIMASMYNLQRILKGFSRHIYHEDEWLHTAIAST